VSSRSASWSNTWTGGSPGSRSDLDVVVASGEREHAVDVSAAQENQPPPGLLAQMLALTIE
jgi:hypothetical protein